MKYQAISVRGLIVPEQETLFEEQHKNGWKLVCIDKHDFAWFVEID